jgi:hypothetical protein
MRNLYSRLDISQEASLEEIKVAIMACKNSSIKADASAVLLSESRRRTYNQLNSVLTDIGFLRTALGLSHASNWSGEISIEYARSSGIARSIYAEWEKKLKVLGALAKSKEPSDSDKESVVSKLKLLVGFAAVIWVFWVFMVELGRPSPSRTPKSSSQSLSPKPAFTEPALPLLRNGTMRKHTSANLVAPLEIKTSDGSNYLVKLDEINSGRNILDIFVQGGEKVEISVPLGSYEIKYAAGVTWYGYPHLFGPETSYNKANTIFTFKSDRHGVTGYTITLYQVSGGNLTTSQISSEQFW